MKKFYHLCLVISLTVTLYACQSGTENSNESIAEKDAVMEITKKDLPQKEVVDVTEDQSVKDYLTEKGFMITSGGKTIYREDQLTDASLDKITSSIVALEKDGETNQQAIFYLKVAGSALDNDKSSYQFIRENLANKSYMDDLDKMVKFTQRQDRPIIKKAILNTVTVMTTTQCADYLKYVGYVQGSNSINTTFNPNALKSVPMFLKLALFNKLKSSKEDQETLIYVHMKKDMGVNS